ncbi:MAG TPA: right-handed parallel beta-helix repeat-containing protein [Planctomycetota bacterium]|nr:right-handed parallel beta-helix repeat-containing protein [Planctomycetota bacterium]
MPFRVSVFVGAVALAACAPAQFSGLYTVHPQRPASPTNFQSLGAATAALAAQGVSGPTTFEIYDDAGPFVETQTYYISGDPVLGSNHTLGNNLCVLLLAAWPGTSPVNRVTFRAAPGETPILDATGKSVAVYFNGADYVTLEGLHIVGATFDAISLYTSSSQSALANHIVRCRVANCGGVGVLVYGNSGPVNDTLIANNVFENLQSVGGGGFSGFVRDGYVSGRRDNNTKVLNNTFLVGTLAGTLPPFVIGNYPSGASYTAFTEVRGNVVLKTVANGVVYHHQTISNTTAPTLPLVADQNVFWTPNGGNFARTQGVNYATLAAWQAAFVSQEPSSQVADPLFAAAPAAPWHLSAISPCRDVGPLLGLVEDFEGQARDAFPDVGADEFLGDPAATLAYAGSGCAGTGGTFQTLVANAPPYLGNFAFGLSADRVPVGAPVALFFAVGLDATPLFFGSGCRVYLDQASLFSLIGTPFFPLIQTTGGSPGTFLAIPVPNDPAIVGIPCAFQALILDGGAPLGYTFTNAVVATPH